MKELAKIIGLLISLPLAFVAMLLAAAVKVLSGMELVNHCKSCTCPKKP